MKTKRKKGGREIKQEEERKGNSNYLKHSKYFKSEFYNSLYANHICAYMVNCSRQGEKVE